MPRSIAQTYVGLDVSSASIQVALLRPDGEIDEQKVPNTPEAVTALVRRWGRPAQIRACYEAGPHGYEPQRRLSGLGVDCQVIAPALIPVRPGSRIKTDRRDARNLCRLLRAGELTAVRVPDPEDEAVRDLLRLRSNGSSRGAISASCCAASPRTSSSLRQPERRAECVCELMKWSTK